MAPALEVLKRFQLSNSGNPESERRLLELLPPLTEEEFGRLERQIPCPIPDEARDLFQYARGFKVLNPHLHGLDKELSTVDLSGLDAQFGLEEIFPNGLCIADDVCGNEWVVDLTSDSTSWGPIFYASHDAPVIAYQTDSLGDFVEEVLKVSSPKNSSKLELVQDEIVPEIWSKNPSVLTHEDCTKSEDEQLRAFAASLDNSYEFIDMRKARLGDGFSWGRYGTTNKRFGEKRIFAYQKRTKWEMFKGFWKL